MKSHLPKDYRPSGLQHKKLEPGLHLPAGFIWELQSINKNLHVVWHPFEVLYEDLVMNTYTGQAADPRWNIHEFSGQEIWGYPLTLPDGSPKPDETWHIWHLNHDGGGWNHVSNIASVLPSHLNRIINRLGREKIYKAKYGAIDWMHKLRDDQEAFELAKQSEKDNLFKDISSANSGMMRRVMENYASGITAPTRPTKDIITSFAGQTNRSKITRDLTDREGGLIVPD